MGLDSLTDRRILDVMTASLERFRDPTFLRENVFLGHSESQIGQPLRELLSLRYVLEQVNAAELQRELVGQQNRLLRPYTILTAVIAVATAVNVWLAYAR